MKTYLLVGVSTINYTDKKTGQPRQLNKLNFTYEDPSDKQLVGSGVSSEVISDRVFQDSHYEPVVGDKLHLFYEPDFTGKARLVSIQSVSK